MRTVCGRTLKAQRFIAAKDWRTACENEHALARAEFCSLCAAADERVAGLVTVSGVTVVKLPEAPEVPGLREALAANAHDAWSRWMIYLFCQCGEGRESGDVVLPASFASMWKRKAGTPYDELTESERESDRAEADRMLAIMRKHSEGES
jgi:hypothetical protein